MALTVQWVGNPSVPGIIFKIDGGRTADGRTDEEGGGGEGKGHLSHALPLSHARHQISGDTRDRWSAAVFIHVE